MRTLLLAAAAALQSILVVTAQVPDNLVVEGVPSITPGLRKDVGRYLEFRAASFNNWHPQRREMLISTRFADSTQLHLVKAPGGARRQLTFFPDPVLPGTSTEVTVRHSPPIISHRFRTATDGKPEIICGCSESVGEQRSGTKQKRHGEQSTPWRRNLYWKLRLLRTCSSSLP